MKKINPIKRSKQLVPLSRDHHDALLFIWKIRQGLKNKTPVAVVGDYVKWFWNNHLKDHFDQEEKILLPNLPNEDELVQRLKQEHVMIRNMIDKESNETSISILGDALNDHIRFEERQLFPHIEQTVSEDQLNEISRQLDHQPSCKTEWHNAFWEK
jgi:hemerythrin-like domain-containing protein